MSDEYERRWSDLYHASAREEPSVSIDAKILAAARNETRGRTPFASHWGVPLALAAVVVLSASLVIVMRDTTQLSSEDVSVAKEPQVSPPVAEADKPTAAVGESGQKRETESQKITKTEQTRAKLPEPGRLDRAQADRLANRGLTKEITASAAAPADPAPSAPASVPAQQPASPSRPDPLARSEAVERAPIQSASTPAPARDQVEPPRVSDVAIAESRQSKVLAAERLARRPSVGAVAENAQRSDARADDALSPEQWLQRIDRLRKEGKDSEAQASFAEFRKRFPTYPLPETFK